MSSLRIEHCTQRSGAGGVSSLCLRVRRLVGTAGPSDYVIGVTSNLGIAQRVRLHDTQGWRRMMLVFDERSRQGADDAAGAVARQLGVQPQLEVEDAGREVDDLHHVYVLLK